MFQNIDVLLLNVVASIIEYIRALITNNNLPAAYHIRKMTKVRYMLCHGRLFECEWKSTSLHTP